MNLADQAGKSVRLRGTAGNAHAGAVLLRDGEPPVYVAGLADWGLATGLTVEVTGVLEVQQATGTADPAGRISHGLAGDVLQLRDADWHPVPVPPSR
ncbi:MULTISPECIES: hypothetical protein [unclassified Crossiella]|uniref:hypothetical protein n=1 Tax=unclassified Crossiella TaxID=2620835 RepID=UPI001FFF14BE|nr:MULTISPECIES: hypothetical protein [unclassified Crossiella]MCK2243583.1 hypothetical protein [Crossiella sp. S99.2]MCK2257441.1 hypothetical protein [Crossiella sp. S99.1]